MAYTPPSGGALFVDLSTGGAYTPPSCNSIIVDLATDDGDSGVTQFIHANGSLTLQGYGPAKGVIQHTLDASAALTLAGYAPLSRVTRTSTLSSAGVLSLTAQAPTSKSVKSSPVSAVGQAVLAAYQPTYFKGMTQQIVEVPALSLAGYGVTDTKRSVSEVAAGSMLLAVYAISQRVHMILDTYGSMLLSPQTDIVQKQLIRKAVVSAYFTPDVTLDTSGTLTLSAYEPAAYLHRIRAGVEARYGLMFKTMVSIVGQYSNRVGAAVSSQYTINAPVLKAVVSPYGILATDRVLAEVVSSYRTTITAVVSSTYSLSSPVAVRSGISASYAVVQNVPARNAIASGYSSLTNLPVRNAVVASYSYQSTVRTAFSSFFHMTLPVAGAVQSGYSIEPVGYARAAVTGVYSAPDSQVVSITTAPYLECLGQQMGITEAELSIAEGDYAWKATIVLTNVADYVKLRQDQPFSVVIGPERYEFIVDSKELDRSSPANYGMKLLGISPAAMWSTPRHTAQDYLWDSYAQASTIAKELLPGLDWQIVDWGIPAYRLAVQDSTPIEVVKLLAEAVGAVLESDIDGSLHVRSRFPVSVPNYGAVAPNHVLLESTDITQVTEAYVSSEVYNRLVITDVSQDISDSLEWIPDYTEATTGVVRAFLYPWRSAVKLLHTGVPAVSIAEPTLGMEEHEEIIEVFKGQAQTSYPIHRVQSIEYEAQNVGALLFDADSRSFSVGGPSFNSVIRLVYWTRSLDFRVALPTTRPTQFLLESEPL